MTQGPRLNGGTHGAKGFESEGDAGKGEDADEDCWIFHWLPGARISVSGQLITCPIAGIMVEGGVGPVYPVTLIVKVVLNQAPNPPVSRNTVTDSDELDTGSRHDSRTT